jgi:hypothetical protein
MVKLPNKSSKTNEMGDYLKRTGYFTPTTAVTVFVKRQLLTGVDSGSYFESAGLNKLSTRTNL